MNPAFTPSIFHPKGFHCVHIQKKMVFRENVTLNHIIIQMKRFFGSGPQMGSGIVKSNIQSLFIFPILRLMN